MSSGMGGGLGEAGVGGRNRRSAAGDSRAAMGAAQLPFSPTKPNGVTNRANGQNITRIKSQSLKKGKITIKL